MKRQQSQRKTFTEPERLILKTAAARRDRCVLSWLKSLQADVGKRDAIVLPMLSAACSPRRQRLRTLPFGGLAKRAAG